MDQASIDRLSKRIKAHESLKLTSYRCPTGHWTIGWGHNLEANPIPGIPARAGITITREQAERLLVADIIDFRQRVLGRVPGARELDDVRLAVLIEMAFNMGLDSVMGFRKMVRALGQGDYARAAAEVVDSDPGRGQGRDKDGNVVACPGLAPRYAELARMMETGEWPEGVSA